MTAASRPRPPWAATPPDTGRVAAAGLGWLRTAIGLAMLAAPSLLPRLLGADRTTARRLDYLTRMVGIREVALGAGTLRAVQVHDDPRPWVAAQAASDAGDGLSVGLALGHARVNRLAGGMIVVFALVGVAADLVTHRLVAQARDAGRRPIRRV